MDQPISQEQFDLTLDQLHISDVSHLTIRQCTMVGSALEAVAQVPFSHLEIGVPGLPASSVGIAAQRKALNEGVAAVYPPVQGIPALKESAARFVRAFIGIGIDPRGIVPTVGSMQGSWVSVLACANLQPGKDKILYLCPGFSPHGRQPDLLGIANLCFDVYEHRAGGLREKLEEILSAGDVAAMLYSNPNNPAWICLTPEELAVIGELARKYDVIVIEDMAYLCMDFREDRSAPFKPPYQPTVARYTDQYILLLSASKIFSYAGERIGVACISNALYRSEYPALKERWGIGDFGDNFILNYLYVNSAGTSHSAQHALAAMMDAATAGTLDFVGELREYAARAHRARAIFEGRGFHLVYDRDIAQPIGDGFFFTVGYGTMENRPLMEALLRCGIVAVSLNTTGSRQKGIRVCVSRLCGEEDFRRLEAHLDLFVKLVSKQ